MKNGLYSSHSTGLQSSLLLPLGQAKILNTSVISQEKKIEVSNNGISGSNSDHWSRKSESSKDEGLANVTAETISAKLDSDACRLGAPPYLLIVHGDIGQ